MPLLFSSAANAAGNGSGIATVSLLGYVGFTIGPPLIGSISDVLGLRTALVLVVVAVLGVAAFSRTVAATELVRRSDRTVNRSTIAQARA